MVTGDQHAIAVETSKRLGLGTNIMEGAELMGGSMDDRLASHVSPADVALAGCGRWIWLCVLGVGAGCCLWPRM